MTKYLAVLLLFTLISPAFGFIAKTTSYTGSEDGNYKNCQGQRLKEGMVAADLRYYKLGQKILINNKQYIIADCGSAIKGRYHFDVFCKTLKAMRQRGTIFANVEILAADEDLSNIPCIYPKKVVYSSKSHVNFKPKEELVCLDF